MSRSRPLASNRRRVARQPAFAGSACACAAGALLVASGCRQLLSTNRYDVAADAGAGCELAEPVKPPSESNVGGHHELTFAVRRFDVGDGSLTDGGLTAGEIGYDVDGVCSSPSNPGRCTNAGKAVPDGPGGRDNAIGTLIAGIQTFIPGYHLNVQIMNDQVELGSIPPQALFRVRDYGGDRDDDAVTVDWLLPSLLTNASTEPDVSAGQGGTAGEGGAAGTGTVDVVVPQWTSADHWPIFPDTFKRAKRTSCSPLLDTELEKAQPRTSTSAYINDQHLVAHFPDGLPIRFWVFENPLIDVVLTADLVFNYATGKFEMSNGVISGLAPSWALLRDIPALQAMMGMQPECRSSMIYEKTKQFVCSTVDWSCDSDRNASCDWASVGIAFDTAPASVGNMLPEPAVADPCPDNDDPALDSCAN